MARFDHRYATELQVAIWLSLFLVFAADLATPLGFVVWVLYLMPLILCLLGWRPAMPIVVSALTTVLTLLGFFLSPPGFGPAWIPMANRILGLLMIWGLPVSSGINS